MFTHNVAIAVQIISAPPRRFSSISIVRMNTQTTHHRTRYRIGVDLGGTKIEAVALAAGGTVAWRERVPTPKASADDIMTRLRGW